MASVDETGAAGYNWEEGIYQLEMTDPVKAGPDGIANRQARELATRTRNLHDRLVQLFASKADKESPALTGTPTAPTPAPGTNSTQLATTAFVLTAIAALIDSSPAALDTLNELAAALGDDPNFATTITNALADKVANTDPRLSDTRTPSDLSVTYTKVADALKSKVTVTSNIDLSTAGIGQITLAANTAFSFSGYQLNKSYLLIVNANGFLPSFAAAARHLEVLGNAKFNTVNTFYVSLTCVDATEGSEKLLTTIMRSV
jgi:hypothetical protein